MLALIDLVVRYCQMFLCNEMRALQTDTGRVQIMQHVCVEGRARAFIDVGRAGY